MKKDIGQPRKMAVPAGFTDALGADHASIGLQPIVIKASKKAAGGGARQPKKVW